MERESVIPSISIIINNYNYGECLAHAIESCLSQDYADCETVVVDDGSTDNSRRVIERYRGITAVLKSNGGQGSARNAGFQASHGDIVIFLDSDDALAPSAAGYVAAAFAPPDVVKVHWPLRIIDKAGRETGHLREPKLPQGDFRQHVRDFGPGTEDALPSAPTSGNAFRRSFLANVLPVPEPVFQAAVDSYLFGLAPAFGLIRTIEEPVGYYRIHGQNESRKSFEEKLALGMASYEAQCERLRTLLTFDNGRVEKWRKHGWWSKISTAIEEILRLVPEEGAFILCDQDGWGTDKEA